MPIDLVSQLPKLPVKTSLVIFLVFIFSSIMAYALTPNLLAVTNPPILEKVVPLKIGGWRDNPSPYLQVSVNTTAQKISDLIYDQVLMRSYIDDSGNQLMMAIAYAQEQRQEIKVHQPEVCYPAQGYELLQTKAHVFQLPNYPAPILGKQQIFRKDNRMEAVSYWIRVGDSFLTSGLQMRIKIIEDGLKGRLDDGILVRVSTIISDPSEAENAFQIQEKFLDELVTTVQANSPAILVPSNPIPAH